MNMLDCDNPCGSLTRFISSTDTKSDAPGRSLFHLDLTHEFTSRRVCAFRLSDSFVFHDGRPSVTGHVVYNGVLWRALYVSALNDRYLGLNASGRSPLLIARGTAGTSLMLSGNCIENFGNNVASISRMYFYIERPTNDSTWISEHLSIFEYYLGNAIEYPDHI